MTHLSEGNSLRYLPWKLIINMKCIYFDASLDTAVIHNFKKRSYSPSLLKYSLSWQFQLTSASDTRWHHLAGVVRLLSIFRKWLRGRAQLTSCFKPEPHCLLPAPLPSAEAVFVSSLSWYLVPVSWLFLWHVPYSSS